MNKEVDNSLDTCVAQLCLSCHRVFMIRRFGIERAGEEVTGEHVSSNDRPDRSTSHDPRYFPITSTENESASSGPRPRPPAGAGPNFAAATKTRWVVGSSPRLRENGACRGFA